MKKTSIQYSIAEPCHEKWGKMTPIDQGRFCDSCAKAVVDFTTMTDRQVIQYMSTTTESVCGRMSSHQLNRPFTQLEIGNSHSFSLRALVLGTAISTFSATSAQAQGEIKTVSHTKGKVAVEQVEVVKVGEIEAIQPIEARDSLFSGTVFDYLGNTGVGATEITIYDAEGNELSTTLSNDKGEFQLPILANQQPYSAVFRKEEYEEVTYLFSDLLTYRGVTVDLSREMHIKMGMVMPNKPDEGE